MALPGRMPKDIRLGRGLSAEWTDVPNAPYDGPSPDLPQHEIFLWYPEVTEWWEGVRRMPHCALWSEMDWKFARETAYMKQDWWRNYFGDETVHANKSTEIRRREDQMGTTSEARRKLRIRYVDPDLLAGAHDTTTSTSEAANVTDIKSRRKRLAG